MNNELNLIIPVGVLNVFRDEEIIFGSPDQAKRKCRDRLVVSKNNIVSFDGEPLSISEVILRWNETKASPR